MLGYGVENELLDKDNNIAKTDTNWGVIPLAVRDVFDGLGKLQQNKNKPVSAGEGAGAGANDADAYRHTCKCSYMQVYHGKLYDLLRDKTRTNPLAIREQYEDNDKNKKMRVHVEGLSEFLVSGLEDVMGLLHQGSCNRAVRRTEYNDTSSRSHAILQMSVAVEIPDSASGRTIIRQAKLNLVDLAGSER